MYDMPQPGAVLRPWRDRAQNEGPVCVRAVYIINAMSSTPTIRTQVRQGSPPLYTL